MKLNDYSLPEATREWIIKNMASGASILEFGSGEGSAELAKNGFNMTCIEHDFKCLEKYKNINYIHAPLDKLWYSLNPSLLSTHYDLIIVDGPPGSWSRREKFIPFYKKYLFNACKLLMIDDFHREDGELIVTQLHEQFMIKSKLDIEEEGRSSWVGKLGFMK